MDANDTRFHLLMRRADWFPDTPDCEPDPDELRLVWDEQRGAVSLRPLLFRFQVPGGEAPFALTDRRGAGRDRYGNWYWIDSAETEIRFLPSGQTGSQHFWSAADLRHEKHEAEPGQFRPVKAAPPSVLTFRGLAVTADHYLVVGVLDPAGVLVFDLHAGGPPSWVLWPEQVAFTPFDMAPAPGGGAWILDITGEPRYWALDRNFRVARADQDALETGPAPPDQFGPVEGERPPPKGAPTFPTGIPVAADAPAAIEGLPDGSVLILDPGPAAGPSRVLRYRCGELKGEAPLTIPPELLEEPYTLRAFDIAFVPTGAGRPGTPSDPGSGAPSGAVAGTLYAAAVEGNQSFAFSLQADDDSLTLALQLRYLPMRRFGGKALAATDDGPFYDYKEQWLPLTDGPRPRYEQDGQLTTGIFDGREPDCVWHRLFLDGCIPTGAAVRIQSRTADDRNAVCDAEWRDEPVPYLRGGGAELPWYDPGDDLDGASTRELLLQHAVGRYLQLRLTVTGTGTNTPRLRALRVYYPRFSYLKEYLPAVYRDDGVSAAFLDRFLANPEGLFTALEDRIAAAQFLFDVRTAPAEYLDWLAGWFDTILDGAWDERRRRLFLTYAMVLFAQRGTVPGLIRAIRLATEPCPDESLFETCTCERCAGASAGAGALGTAAAGSRTVRIIELFLTRRAPRVIFGDPTDAVGPGVTTEQSNWSPAQGAAPLHARYQDYLRTRYTTIAALNAAWGGPPYTGFDQIEMPPVTPTGRTEADDWREFLLSGLGFYYEPVKRSDRSFWQTFLAGRYRRAERLNQSHGLTGAAAYGSFGQIPLPDAMPEAGAPLHDWIQFASYYLPTVRNAHRFLVLVPTATYGSTRGRGQDLDLVRRIVEQEKPAHTGFDVMEYWAMFRVGEARLGLDTLLDAGSRMTALVLGESYLGQSHLAHAHPWDVTDRLVVGRDRID